MDDLDLQRPEGVDAMAWWAITQHRDRLVSARTAEDRPLIIGSVKELVEAVAKVIVEGRGEPVDSKADFGALIGRAHAVLDRQPGRGLAAEPPLRDLAQGARSIAIALAPLRNACGTGHGRTDVPVITDEMVELAVAGGLLWVRWALSRAGDVLLGSLEPLLSDLRSGATFYAGDLARRLRAADLPALPEPDQRRLGATVARRRMSGTFVVDNDGVEACAASADLDRWPAGYRRGLLDGLLLDNNGTFIATGGSLGVLPRQVGQPADGWDLADR